jgi:hypothetical protein
MPLAGAVRLAACRWRMPLAQAGRPAGGRMLATILLGVKKKAGADLSLQVQIHVFLLQI